MDFLEIQSVYNRLLAKSRILKPLNIIKSPSIDSQLLEILLQFSLLYNLEFPIQEPIETEIKAILNHKLALSSNDFKLLFYPKNTKQSNKTCGKIFKKGQGIYSCKDCRLDETCVLCAECFQAADHSNHNISFYYSQGSGGCCDCGDPEAWKVKGTCKIHNVENNDYVGRQSLSLELLAHISRTIGTVIDMIIMTLKDLPDSIEIPEKLSDAYIVNSIDSNESCQQFCLVLWNDEVHSFNEVIQQLMDIFEYSSQESRHLAELVDKKGRAIIKISENPHDLCSAGRKFARIGLKCSISSVISFARGEMCNLLMEWLNGLPLAVAGEQTIDGVLIESAGKRVREIICTEFTKPFINSNSTGSCRVDYFLTAKNTLWKSPKILMKQIFISTFIIEGGDYKKWLGIRFAKNYLEIAKQHLKDDDKYELTMLSLAVQLFTVPSICQDLVENTKIVSDTLCLIKAIYLKDLKPNQIDLEKKFETSIAAAANFIQPIYEPLNCSSPHLSDSKAYYYLTDLNYIATSLKISDCKLDFFNVSKITNDKSGLFRFLDLLTLFQGIGGQKRAIVAHVEYDSESWINAFNSSLFLLRSIKFIARGYYHLDDFSSNSKIFYLINETMNHLLTWSIHDHLKYVKESSKHNSTTEQKMGFHYRGIGDEKFLIPSRKVAFDTISLHHSLHWFLSFLLMKIPQLLKNCPSNVDLQRFESQLFEKSSSTASPQIEVPEQLTIELMAQILSPLDREMLIFNYPLHAIVYVSQVRAGLWVRNGETTRVEAIHLKDISLRQAYDSNIFLLQYASIKFGSDLFVTNLLDRFDMLYWFGMTSKKGEGENHGPPPTGFEANQEMVLLEDILNLLIILLTERSFLGAYTPSHIIRREIVHQLAVRPSGIAYSALSKLLSSLDIGTSNDPDFQSFDEILYSVSNFKYPDGIVDYGVYTLKEDFYTEVNSWYWHYSKNQHEEIEEILKKKFKDQSHLPIEILLNLPKIDDIGGNFGFEKIGNLINGKVFMQMLLIIWWEIIKPIFKSAENRVRNDSVLSHLIQLILVCIEITKRTYNGVDEVCFINNIESVRFDYCLFTDPPYPRSTCLLEIILAVVDRASHSDIREHRARLRHIVGQFETLGNPNVQRIISGWRDKSRWNFFNQNVPKNAVSAEDGHNEAKKRKLASKARQAAIMAQFSQAQSSFMANYDDEMDDMDLEEEQALKTDDQKYEEFPESKNITFCEGVCIVCTEDVHNTSKPFGLLCMFQRSAIRRKVDFGDLRHLTHIAQTPLSLDKAVNRRIVENVTVENVAQVVDDDHFFINKTETDCNGSRFSHVGTTSTTCGHLMHISCFETYLKSIHVRQNSQMFRNHPENLDQNEILCPLCKILGNVLLPILWDHTIYRTNWRGSTDVVDLSLVEYFTHEIPFQLANIESGSGQMNIDIYSDSVPEISHLDLREKISKSMSILIQKGEARSAIQTIENEKFTYERFLFDHFDTQLLTADKQDLSNPIWDTFISTICSVEIMTRGADSLSSRYSTMSDHVVEVGILDRINAHTMMLLRVLSETCLSTLILRMRTSKDVLSYVLKFINCVLPSAEHLPTDRILLQNDGFTNLVYISMSLIPILGGQKDFIYCWCQLFAIFELVRTIVSLFESYFLHGSQWSDHFINSNLDIDIDQRPEDIEIMKTLIRIVANAFELKNGADQFMNNVNMAVIVRLSKLAILVYARKVSILLCTRFAEVPVTGSTGFGNHLLATTDNSVEKSELDRLLSYLGVGNFSELLENINASFIQGMINHWCIGLKESSYRYWVTLDQSSSSRADLFAIPVIQIDQPCVFELIRLPRKLEVLFENALKTICVNCNQVPQDPALCLFCGTFVCTQSYCCGIGNKGECNVHMETCGIEMGAYMNIKKCSILLLSSTNGTFMNSPYLDTHGEVDPGLRRAKPQFLNQKRYEEIRRLWLTHGIPSYVARKIEQNYDSGGWTTL